MRKNTAPMSRENTRIERPTASGLDESAVTDADTILPGERTLQGGGRPCHRGRIKES